MTPPDVRTPGGNRADSGQTAADTAIVPPQSPADKAARKRFENLRARLCLRGHQLHELLDGSFLVSRWNLTRDLPDLDAVEAFAKKVGA